MKNAQKPLPQALDVNTTDSSVSPFKARHFLDSLAFAVQGLRFAFQTERNLRIQSGIAVLTIAAGVYFHLSQSEWLWIFFSMAWMLTMELLNTCIEAMLDLQLGNQYHQAVGRIKDIAAAACLITAIGVGLIGLLVFCPHLIHAWRLAGK